jgi:group I intron endonuclease
MKNWAHFHYVLSMGAVFALFAAFYYWTPKIVGKNSNELLGNIHFWTMFVGVIQKLQECILIVFIYLLNKFYYLIKYNSITEVVGREIIDDDINDIDNETLNNKLNNLPTPKNPKSNKKKNKHILDKLYNIQAETKFIDIITSKLDILLNIKNKSGVYMFFNLVNGNCYIGSSVKLARRFRVHMSCINSVELPLYRAFKKYGLNNFVFLVLQYCEQVEDICLGLEQTYIDLYKPKYNILKIAGSSQGFKHSVETIAKLKETHAGKLHPRFGSKVLEQQKLLTSIALKRYFLEHGQHNKGKKGILAPQYGIGGTKIKMINELGEVILFLSINSARQHFKVRFTTISENKNTNIPINIRGVKWYINTID